MSLTNTEARIALARHMAKLGLSPAEYAVEVLYRAQRTIYRWMNGEAPIPLAVRQFLEKQEGV